MRLQEAVATPRSSEYSLNSVLQQQLPPVLHNMGLSEDFQRSFRGLSEDFQRTFRGLSEGFQRAFRGLSEDFQSWTFRGLSEDFQRDL